MNVQDNPRKESQWKQLTMYLAFYLEYERKHETLMPIVETSSESEAAGKTGKTAAAIHERPR
jgi:hypothetical protein